MGGGQHAYLEAMQNLRSVARLATDDDARATVDRAVGLLAGRTRCRLAEAHRHLLRMAADQNREVVDVAAGVIGLLDIPEPADDRGPPPALPLPPPPAEPWPAEGESDRIASTERLGNLGWGEWDLVSGEVRWSAQLYRIYERDPALGPLSTRESEALAVPEDAPLRLAAAAAFERAEQVDLTSRIRINGRIKYLRTVADAIRDDAGRPLRVYGIVQDVTARETSARRLAEVEQQLVEHRRSLHAEHELAGRLYDVILPIPERPVELPGVKVAVRYLPAGQESKVGGDWYHAAALRDGSVLLAIGDVAGHGSQAATTMAQLRYSLRALAVTTTDPAELLGYLNQITCDLDEERPETAATAIVARYEPALRRLTWAQAGHPPPLLSRGGRTRPLPRPGGPMLGVVREAVYERAELRLDFGNLLLLYTDGLVEYRGRSLDEGMDAVIRTVDEAVAAAPRQPLAELVSRLRQANPDDDTCIMAVRPVTGETRDLRRYLDRP